MGIYLLMIAGAMLLIMSFNDVDGDYFQSPSNISFSLITLSFLMNVVAMSMLLFISS